MNKKQILKMAMAAHRQGQTQDANPFDAKQSPAEHEEWRIAFDDEVAWWEYQLGIVVHGR